MKKLKPFHLVAAAVLAIVFFLFDPLAMDMSQRFLFSGLIFTVGLWATEAVHKTIACIILLVFFFVFGKTPPFEIIRFAWSDTILLIIATTLLSVGMMKTGIVQRFVEKVFFKKPPGLFKLLLLPYAFGIVSVFLIPQAFARVIIIGTIFHALLQASDENQKKAKQAIIFNGFIAVTMTYMFFSNGDIVLNQAAIKFAGEEVQQALTFNRWFVMMAFPSLITSIAALSAVYIIFKKDLQGFSQNMISSSNTEHKEFSVAKQKIGVITMILIIAFWMTQSFHPFKPSSVAFAGVLILFAAKILDRSDLKSVNPHLILFLITVFNIGKVLGQSGITAIIFEHLKLLIPSSNSSLYLLIIAAVVMVLHLCIGSSVATMSVVLPILMPLTQNLGYRGEVITLMTYIIVNIHFLLPFHHATVMIGTARDYYPEKYMLRFGLPMSIITFILLGAAYFPWWRILEAL